MAKVLINCVSAGSGGALAYLINLIPKLLDKAEHSDVEFFLLIKNEQYKLIDSKYKKNVIFAPDYYSYRRFIWEYIRLPKIIDDYDIDLVYTPYQIARILSNVKNVVMFRNMEPFTFHKYKNTYKNWLRNVILKIKTKNTIKNADRVIAVSNYVKQVMLDNDIADITSITRIYHGRNKQFNSEIASTDKSVLNALNIKGDYIFTCGSLFPYRKCEDIIKSYARISAENKVLVIAGTSNDEQYKGMLASLIEQYNLSDSVYMTGHVSLEEMIVLYRNCKVFVTATETEACPNIAIEAMSSGCNILSSDLMPLPEIFGDAASYFKHGDIDQLAISLEDMFIHGQGVNSKALSIIESFNWDKCADETFDLIIKELTI